MSQGDAALAMTGLAQLEGLVTTAIQASHAERTDILTDLLVERAEAELGGVPDREMLYLISGLIFAGQTTTDSVLGFLRAHQLDRGLDRTVEALATSTRRWTPS